MLLPLIIIHKSTTSFSHEKINKITSIMILTKPFQSRLIYFLKEKSVCRVVFEFPPTKTLKSPGSASHFLLIV